MCSEGELSSGKKKIGNLEGGPAFKGGLGRQLFPPLTDRSLQTMLYCAYGALHLIGVASVDKVVVDHKSWWIIREGGKS